MTISAAARLSNGVSLDTTPHQDAIESGDARDALRESYAIQVEASEVGFDWSDIREVLAKVEEELEEIREALAEQDYERARNELGDLLFASVNLARFLDIQPETVLDESNRKFLRRFQELKQRVRDTGRKMQSYSLRELDEIWEEIKRETEG